MPPLRSGHQIGNTFVPSSGSCRVPLCPAGVGTLAGGVITGPAATLAALSGRSRWPRSRKNRTELKTRWRRLEPGRQALLVLAYLRKGETYADLAIGFDVGTTTVYRYVREALDLLAATAPALARATEVARGKVYVILDGSLLRIDRVGMTAKAARPYHSGKQKCHGLNVQVLADPAGRLIWVSPALPGSRHDIAAAREHGLFDASDRHRAARHARRHRLPGRWPHHAGTAAPAAPRPGHRPLPRALGQPEGRQHRPRPPAWTR